MLTRAKRARALRALVDGMRSDALLFAVLLDGLTVEEDGAYAALGGLAQERYGPVQDAVHKRVQLGLADALLLELRALVVGKQFIVVYRAFAVVPHKVAEQDRACGDALELDEIVVAAAAASC